MISLTEQCLKLTELPSTFSATGKQNCLTIRMQHARHPKFNMDAILDPFWNAKSQWNTCTYMPYKLEANYTKYKTPVLSKSKTGSGQQYIGDIFANSEIFLTRSCEHSVLEPPPLFTSTFCSCFFHVSPPKPIRIPAHFLQPKRTLYRQLH